MVQLRTRPHAVAILRILFAVCVVLSMAGVAEAGAWWFDDEQFQGAPDYNYRLRRFKFNGGTGTWDAFGNVSYDYAGQFWIDGLGWHYKWTVLNQIFGVGIDENTQFYGVVEYQYLGGNWHYQGTIYPTWVP